MQCTMLEAQNQLAKLVHAALAGEEVIIANKGVPMVRLVKFSAPKFSRTPGAWAGLPKADADWDAPTTNADLAQALAAGELP